MAAFSRSAVSLTIGRGSTVRGLSLPTAGILRARPVLAAASSRSRWPCRRGHSPATPVVLRQGALITRRSTAPAATLEMNRWQHTVAKQIIQPDLGGVPAKRQFAVRNENRLTYPGLSG